MSTSNPAFNDKLFNDLQRTQGPITMPATIQGTVNKTFFLLMIITAVSMGTWMYAEQLIGMLMPIAIVTGIIQIGMTFYIVRNPASSKNLAIVYAIIEGLVLGPLSYLFEQSYEGIVFQAIIGTIGVILGMLLIYKLQIIKVTENFKIMVASATMGIFFIYLVSIIMGMFGTQIPLIHEGGTWGIVFSLFVIGVAAFNLAVDFDFIEKCEEQRAPSYMEWYGAFGLMLTIIWLYIEMLRLLSKSRK